MENICPFFKTSEEKHVIRTCVALEHMTTCESRIRDCDVPLCAFKGNRQEMETHQEDCIVHHNALLARAHEELLEEVKNKPEEAGKDYQRRVRSIWSKTWHIQDFRRHANHAKSQDMPLTSGNFKKGDQVWRFVFFPSESEIFLQLVSSKEPQNVKVTIAVQDFAFSFPAVSLKEKEMVGGKIEETHKYHEVEVKVAVTNYEYRKQIPYTHQQSASMVHEAAEGSRCEKTAIEEFVDVLTSKRIMERILERAEVETRNLPRDVGRGGKSGLSSFKAMDERTRAIFEERLNAPEPLAALVDDLVNERFMKQLYNINLLDDIYCSGNSGRTGDQTQSIKAFGNKSMYVSGAIIQHFKKRHNNE